MNNHRISDDKLRELEPQIAQWKNKHRNIVLIKLSEDPFDGIFRVPDHEDIKAINRLKDDLDKNMQLALSCLLYPAIDAFNAVLDERSGIVVPLSIRLLDEYGINQETTAKKL